MLQLHIPDPQDYFPQGVGSGVGQRSSIKAAMEGLSCSRNKHVRLGVVYIMLCFIFLTHQFPALLPYPRSAG